MVGRAEIEKTKFNNKKPEPPRRKVVKSLNRMKTVEIFKTNVQNNKDADKITTSLPHHLSQIYMCITDQTACLKILGNIQYYSTTAHDGFKLDSIVPVFADVLDVSGFEPLNC